MVMLCHTRSASPRPSNHTSPLLTMVSFSSRFTVVPIKKTWHRVRAAKMAFIDGVEGENTIMHMSNTLPEFRIAEASNYIEEYALVIGRCTHLPLPPLLTTIPPHPKPTPKPTSTHTHTHRKPLSGHQHQHRRHQSKAAPPPPPSLHRRCQDPFLSRRPFLTRLPVACSLTSGYDCAGLSL